MNPKKRLSLNDLGGFSFNLTFWLKFAIMSNMKKCTSCLLQKDESEFNRRGKNNPKLRTYCKDCSYLKINKERKREIQKKFEGTPNGKQYKRDYQRQYLRELRLEVIKALGGKCVRCGFSDSRALQIDHINGGGNHERKFLGFSSGFHRKVLVSISNNEGKYQLLCANCNWIKRMENKEFCSKTCKKDGIGV